MLALRKTAAASGAELVEVPATEAPQPGEVVVAVAAAGICGSDLHAYEWTAGYGFMAEHMPLTLGHEFSGTVLEAGPDAGITLGSRVVCWPTVGCGRCTACANGSPQACKGRVIIGLHRDGGFARTVRVPARSCRVLPDDLPLGVAALAEPLAVAVNAVRVGGVGGGDRVVVLGPGPIGLAAAFVAQEAGAAVLLAGLDDRARMAAARAIGIAHRADLAETTLADAVSDAFDGAPADCVIEATGAARSVADGLAVLRTGGVVVVAGIHGEPLTLDLTTLVRSRHQLRGAHDTTAEAFDEAIALLRRHQHVLSCLITHRLPLERALEAFELARSRSAVKVLIEPARGRQEAVR